MTKWITIAILVLFVAQLAFAQTLSNAEYQKLKEQIKQEVIQELKAEYNLVPKTKTTSTESTSEKNKVAKQKTSAPEQKKSVSTIEIKQKRSTKAQRLTKGKTTENKKSSELPSEK